MRKLLTILLVLSASVCFGQAWNTGQVKPTGATSLQALNNVTWYINKEDSILWARLGALGDYKVVSANLLKKYRLIADTVRLKGTATNFALLRYRLLTDHDSLSKLDEKSYNSLTDKPDLTGLVHTNRAALDLVSGTNTGDNATNTTSNSYADGKVSDATYSGTWDGITTIAPSKNSVYDKIATLESVNYCAATMTVTYGTLNQGVVTDLCAAGGTDVIIQERTANPPFQINFTFSGVQRISGLKFYGRYNGGSTHNVHVEAYNYTTSTWDYVGELSTTVNKQWFAYNLNIPNNYLSGGDVLVRIIHQDSGIITHQMILDYINVNYGGGGGSGFITAGAVENTPNGNISATNVQAAINELDSEKEPLLTKGNLTAGSTKIAIGGANTGAVIGSGVNIDINEANLSLQNIGGAVADIQVPNTISLDNITQITNRSHTSLSDVGTNAHSTIDTFIASKGANSGLATLDAGGKIPFTQLPASLMIFKGTWSALNNTPTLVDGSGVAGWVYRNNLAGTVNFGNGDIGFRVGDWVVYDGTNWKRSAGSDAVSSVNGQQGIVTLNTSHIPENTNLYYTETRVAANAAVAANTAKMTNATHTGDATGATELTLKTVNSNIGTFNNVTINAKGLATGGSNVAYAPVSGSANYVQVSPVSAQSGNIWMDGKITQSLITGLTPLFMKTGSGTNWKIGSNAGAFSNDNTFSFYSSTFGASNGVRPIFLMNGISGASNFYGSVSSESTVNSTGYLLNGNNLFSSLTANYLPYWDGGRLGNTVATNETFGIGITKPNGDTYFKATSGTGTGLFGADTNAAFISSNGNLMWYAQSGINNFYQPVKITNLASTTARLLSSSSAGQLTPIADGSNGQVLTTDGSGGYSFGAVSALLPTEIRNEIPTGTPNSSLTNFTIAHTPISGTVIVLLNGLEQVPTINYTISGATIAFNYAPVTNDLIIIHYKY